MDQAGNPTFKLKTARVEKTPIPSDPTGASPSRSPPHAGAGIVCGRPICREPATRRYRIHMPVQDPSQLGGPPTVWRMVGAVRAGVSNHAHEHISSYSACSPARVLWSAGTSAPSISTHTSRVPIYISTHFTLPPSPQFQTPSSRVRPLPPTRSTTLPPQRVLRVRHTPPDGGDHRLGRRHPVPGREPRCVGHHLYPYWSFRARRVPWQPARAPEPGGEKAACLDLCSNACSSLLYAFLVYR